jgi:hypothetical protein
MTVIDAPPSSTLMLKTSGAGLNLATVQIKQRVSVLLD